MSVPPYLLAAALAFWGWRTGHYATAAVLAVLVEAPRFVALRFDLRPPDLQRIADASGTAFVALVLWLLATVEPPRVVRTVLTSLEWVPAILAPVLLSQIWSSTARIPLSSILRYLRKLRSRDPTIPDPPVDMSGVYLVACVLAAGIPNTRDEAFYVAAAALIAWSLWSIRPAHGSRAAWAALVLAAAGLGWAGHRGLTELQSAVGDWIAEWQLRGMAADPYRSSTDLGSVGRLKLIEAIVMRVYATREEAPRLRLLHRASFNALHGNTWVARGAPLRTLEPEADGTTWKLAPHAPQQSARIVTRLEGGKALLSLPPGTMQVSGMAAASVKRNRLGATQAELGGDWAPYVVEFADAADDFAEPRADDEQIPPAERAEFTALALELGLAALPAQERLRRVREHFAGFAYATYREAAVPAGSTALGDFIRRSKSGHCEYFAAATTLLLRAAGVPARYSTGFAVNEWSDLEAAYVVRARHAHAWARAWVDGRWIDVDTTPPSWFAEEEAGAPAWQKLADFMRWAGFRWSQRGPLQGGAGWYAALALLVALFAWRMLRGKRAARAAAAASAAAGVPRAGADSEFFELERRLAARAGARGAHEPLASWTRRAAAALRAPLHEELAAALALHNRYRFDPAGLDAAERDALRARCAALGAALDAALD